MKKILFCIVCVCIAFCSLNVNASCAVGVYVGDEKVCLMDGATQGNSSGTLYPENGTLVMKNYNGGKLEFTSTLGNPLSALKVKLIGDNYIKAEDDFGFKVPLSGV